MLKRLHIRNFTVFADADFEFGPGLNVIIGTNGTGKSHVLKLGYIVEYVRDAVEADRQREPNDNVSVEGSRLDWLSALRHYLGEVFLAGPVKNLIRRQEANKEATISIDFGNELPSRDGKLSFSISPEWTVTDNSMSSYIAPSGKTPVATPIFIPPKEVLSFFPGFISLNRKYRLSFDATYTNLFDALDLPYLRQLSSNIERVKNGIEVIIGGKIILENGQFYLRSFGTDVLEINLVAEGMRKFGMMTQLLANGSLTPQTTLFWDEPEANLNPQLLRELAKVLAELARQGFQIILATHSMSLLKQFHILSREKAELPLPIRYFGLNAEPGQATTVVMREDFKFLPDVVALAVELEQADDLEEIFAREDRQRYADNH